ncbi:MAG: 30S ribosome-binding factor RbfA [Alphaproteobacteria bacterium]
MIFQRISKNQEGGRSQRQRRAGELLRQVVAEIFQQYDQWSRSLGPVSVTITKVEVSPDLRYATVYVMPLGGDQRDAVLKALGKAASTFQKLLIGKVTLKFLPVLRFKLDTSLDEVEHLENLFRNPKVVQDLEKAALAS